MKLINKTVLITGGTSGIGRELARQLLARGNTVVVTGRDPARLAATLGALPGLHGIESDVADPQAIRQLHAQVLARFPALDVLVNNAGVMRNIDLERGRELDDLTREIDINLSGPIRMVQQFLPHLRGKPESLIVNVSSGLAFIPMAISPIYCATKAAMHSYSQSLRAQLANGGVRVVELAPPAVETALLRAEFAEEMKGQKAMDTATLVSKAIAGIESGRAEIRPGLANVLKAMSRIAPDFMFAQMAKMVKPKAA